MLSPDEVDAFISQQIPINTKSKTKTDIGILKRWLIGPASESREIQDIPGTELDKYLQSFYLTAKKPNGDNYEPSSLRSFAYSFDRYLSTNHYGLTITQSGEFKGSRDVLAAKLKQLKSIGKGRKPNQCEPLSFEEEEVLWEKKLLGASNPKSLLNAMWWRNNFFGLRGRDEHRKLTWGDISIQTDIDGRRYLLYHERDTKTRKDPGQHRAYPPRIYEMPEQPDRCPVQLLLEYTHRRPVAMTTAESPFYLTPMQKAGPQIWYKTQPMGIHQLSEIMKKMAVSGGIPGRKTNHSGRKTTIKRLREAEFDNVDIIQLTGHKNAQSLNEYSTVSVKKQRDMSLTLTKSRPNTTCTNNSIDVDDSDTVEQIDSIMQPYDNNSEENCDPNNEIKTLPLCSQSTSYAACTSDQFQMNPLISGSTINGGVFNFNIQIK